MILPRIITAILGVPIVVFAIYFGGIPYFIFVFGITLFALQEYFYLIEKSEYKPIKLVGFLFSILVILSVFFSGTEILSKAAGQLTAFVFTFGLFIMFLSEIILSRTISTLRHSLMRISLSFLGVFIISWTFAHLLLIRDLRPYGFEYTIYLFVLIWAADTGAYLVGIRFGKKRIAEKISPKKTIEGTIGGIIAGILAGIVLWKVLPLKELLLKEIILLSFVIVVIGFVSDLAESLIKRSANVKDTDVLLPGHGGILDRFDSFIFTAPIFYYYLSIFHKSL